MGVGSLFGCEVGTLRKSMLVKEESQIRRNSQISELVWVHLVSVQRGWEQSGKFNNNPLLVWYFSIAWRKLTLALAVEEARGTSYSLLNIPPQSVMREKWERSTTIWTAEGERGTSMRELKSRWKSWNKQSEMVRERREEKAVRLVRWKEMSEVG